MEKIYVPTINDTLKDFLVLFRLREQVEMTSEQEIVFDFTHCRFMRQNAVAFLGGLIRLIQDKKKQCTFKWDTMQKSVFDNLNKNGFTTIFGTQPALSQGNCIPYREDWTQRPDEIIEYIQDSWLNNRWIRLSEDLKAAISGTMWEIYTNAFEHGHSRIAITSCGQHYPNRHELQLTVIDFGVSIPYNVRRFFGNFEMSTDDSLKWAFQSGNSTKSATTGPRGLGLDLLRSFVKLNGGKLEIYSHDGYVSLSGGRDYFNTIGRSFQGTIVNITLKCDEKKFYFLSNEGSKL